MRLGRQVTEGLPPVCGELRLGVGGGACGPKVMSNSLHMYVPMCMIGCSYTDMHIPFVSLLFAIFISQTGISKGPGLMK